MLKFLNNR